MAGRPGFRVQSSRTDVKEQHPSFIKTGQIKGGGWVDDKYPNSKTGKVEAKASYVEAVDGMVIGCGIYK